MARLAEPKLIVMATCHALAFAVEVAPFTNIVATSHNHSGKELEKWLECFYDFLASNMALYDAFEATQEQQFPLVMHFIRHKNIVFKRTT